MEPVVLMLMEKEKDTGYLMGEIGSYRIAEGGELVEKIYLTDNGEKKVHLQLTTAQDLEDWEYNAVYDYYDVEVYGDLIQSIEEIEETHNPVWEVTFPFRDTQEGMEEHLQKIIAVHMRELKSTYEGIQNKREEYL
ncbi:MAG: DUF6762 family protein [Thermotaleaceae bacterium]